MRVIDLIRQVGLPFLLLILVSASVVFAALWRVWRAWPRVGKWLTVFVLLGCTTFVLAKSVSPAGRYAVGGCRGGYEYTNDEFYELAGGVFFDVIAGHRHRCGSYYKRNGQWILKVDRRDNVLDEQKLRFSVLGFDTVIPPIEGSEGAPTNFNRRRLVPFSRPHWIPEWLE